MTKTFKTILMLVAVAVVTSAPLYAARVNNIQLSHQDGVTIARVDVEGTIRFTHQTEIAKDGRPYRVILDILSATHNLGAKNFLDLPSSVVEHIRSSQYQVKPEKVVRLVFDMKSETPYRVQSDPKSVTLFFTDKTSPSFATWSSADAIAHKNAQQPKSVSPPMAQAPATQAAKAVPAKTVAQKNASIESDRQASLSTSTGAQVPSAGTAPAKAMKNTTKAPQDSEPYGPMLLAPADMPNQSAAKPTAKIPVVAQKPQPKVGSSQQASKPAAQPRAEKPMVASAPQKQAAAESSPPPSKEQPKATPKGKAQPSKTMAKADGQESKDTAKKSSTARFRRNVDRKIKGTLVAQFPKRLVIKYKASGRRDPFETLINDTKTVNNPIERRVPNVDGLRLVGVIQGIDGTNSALCEDKDNYGYILKAGEKVQKGYVLRVSADRVYFQIFEYGWSRTVALNLEEY